MKKIMLGTSDPWSTSHLSQQTSKPAYHIVDCRIFGLDQDQMLVYQGQRGTQTTFTTATVQFMAS